MPRAAKPLDRAAIADLALPGLVVHEMTWEGFTDASRRLASDNPEYRQFLRTFAERLCRAKPQKHPL